MNKVLSRLITLVITQTKWFPNRTHGSRTFLLGWLQTDSLLDRYRHLNVWQLWQTLGDQIKLFLLHQKPALPIQMPLLLNCVCIHPVVRAGNQEDIMNAFFCLSPHIQLPSPLTVTAIRGWVSLSLMSFCHTCSQHKVTMLATWTRRIQDQSETGVSHRELGIGKAQVPWRFYNLLCSSYPTASEEETKPRKEKQHFCVTVGT